MRWFAFFTAAYNIPTETKEDSVEEHIICDGCRVKGLWEHRCMGERAMVNGEQTGKACECPDCNCPPSKEELARFLKESGFAKK